MIQHQLWPPGRRLTVARLLVMVGVIALILGIVVPPVRSAREAARRAQCTGHLKQIAFALYEYEQVHGALPPAYTVGADGRPLHSWRTLILPFLNQQALYNTIDLTKPWDDPTNATAAAMPLMVYRCPSADLRPNQTTYLGIASPTAAFHPTSPRPLTDIADGTATTAMVFEADAAHAVPWMAPLDADEALVLKLARMTTDHPGGRHVAFADGSIRFVKTTMAAEVWQALVSIAGQQSGSSSY